MIMIIGILILFFFLFKICTISFVDFFILIFAKIKSSTT